MLPQRIGPYEVLALLGTGGGGCVYRALDTQSATEVAVKLLSATPSLEPTATRRMFREIEMLGELSHPNIVRVFDSGLHLGFPYLVMELIDGLTLGAYLEVDAAGSLTMYQKRRTRAGPRTDDEPLPLFDLDKLAEEGDSAEVRAPEVDLPRLLQEVDALEEPPPSPERRAALARPDRIALLKDFVLQICGALAHVHAHGLVHRDLKPTNIMIDEDRRVRLMDFGLAKHLAEDHGITSAGKIVGTYQYMAPEQILGEPVDGRTDLYALGAILYELLSGAPLFRARTLIDACRQILDTEPEPLLLLSPDLDEELARITHRLLQKDPFERYQTAEEVAEVLGE